MLVVSHEKPLAAQAKRPKTGKLTGFSKSLPLE
jgi:hypothetical protein